MSAHRTTKPTPIRCNICKRSGRDVWPIICGADGNICSDCIDMCREVADEMIGPLRVYRSAVASCEGGLYPVGEAP